MSHVTRHMSLVTFLESKSRSGSIRLDMVHDFRFAFRQLGKARAFAAAAIIVLGLGIGANTAIFSLMNTLLFQPPHYAKADEVVQIFSQDKKNPKMFRGFSY